MEQELSVDLNCPEIPLAIFNLALEDADLTYNDRCSELWNEVILEVLDHEYLKRSHHNVGTYDQGCRGPLCRKALREHPRRKAGNSSAYQLREERLFDPVLEYFHVIIKHRVRTARQSILANLKEQV